MDKTFMRVYIKCPNKTSKQSKYCILRKKKNNKPVYQIGKLSIILSNKLVMTYNSNSSSSLSASAAASSSSSSTTKYGLCTSGLNL